MMKGFTTGMAVGIAAGAAVTVLCMPKGRRNPAMRKAARMCRTVGDVVENVGDIFR